MTSLPIADALRSVVAPADIVRARGPLGVDRFVARIVGTFADQILVAGPIAWDSKAALERRPWDRNCTR